VIRALLCLTTCLVTLEAGRTASLPLQDSSLVDQAFRAAYNLDYDSAIRLGRDATTAAPNDVRAHHALASVIWLDLIFKRGAVTTDAYLSGVLHSPKTLPAPPPDLDAECRREVDRAIELAEAWTKREPNSVEARFEQGEAYAIRASYLASIAGNTTGAFGPARKAFDAEEDVLEHQPARPGAAVIVGLYRYIVSTLGLPSRWFAYMVGFGGDRAKGISMLEGVVAGGGEGHVEAAASLVLIYARERRHGDALTLARKLEAEFPRNRLFTLEAGSAAVRAGRGAEANDILSRGLAALDMDTRPRFPNERATWLMKRGMARTEMGHLADAVTDLRAALAESPSGMVGGRSHLELGRIADLEGQRAGAVAEYRQARDLCTAAHDDPCVNDANRLTDKAFGGKSRGAPGTDVERSPSNRR
jgi:predicted Zn-dependent protease